MIEVDDDRGLGLLRPSADPSLPLARGPLSESLLTALAGTPGDLVLPPLDVDDPLADDDLHLSLYACYELHYRSFAGVDPEWEWEPSLLRVRAQMEAVFEAASRGRRVAACAALPAGHLAVWAHPVRSAQTPDVFGEMYLG